MDAATILEKALEKPTGTDRAKFLDGACGEDAALKAEVLELIQAHDDAGDFLQPNDNPAFAATQVTRSLQEKVGDRIGPYKLLQQIGEGGFGVVYMAEQTEPVKRKVALKVIKPGMDTKEVVARFEAERQALALMDHPNVAKVLDGGATESGRPYFVMELVKGIAITTYCDQNHLPTQQRLQLFISVCEAVQHAHHKGIIHRDLKPSNVLIAEYDDRPVPKIIDFGVAKALNQALTDKTLFTQFGQVIGTLEYMSPEQSRLNQLDIDTRSDIYSLGVLLYELLTGTTPFDRERFRSTRFDEVLRIIGEEEPPRPSTRLAMSDTLPAVAADRATDVKHLPAIIRGDLDWIVMKALAKDRIERYQTPSELVDDVQRHLEFKPISARRPSVLGRVRRFAKRNRSLVSVGSVAAAAILLALALGAFAIRQQQTWTEKEQDRVALESKREEEEAATRRIEAARGQFPRIRKLMDDGLVVAAYRLALDVRQALPKEDASFQTLWKEITSPITLETSPESAEVRICDWDDPGRAWLELGETPLEDIRIPRGLVRWKFESADRDTREYVRDYSNDEFRQVKLFQSPREGMVVVPASRGVRNAGYQAVNKAFLMDRYEVTNRQYKEFVDAGGYNNLELWKHEFILDGEVIVRDLALSKFVDRSGHQGPSTWNDGIYPPEESDFPVSGVSWYEAAAYAEFRGKRLPTIHHWYAASWAAGTARFVIPHSNFSGKRSPVGSHDGVGRLRIFDLAGNVAEWCYNEVSDQSGARSLRGGAFSDPDYMYIGPDLRQVMDRSTRNGFRCVVHRPSEKLTAKIKPRTRVFDKPPASDEVMEVILSRYNYRPKLDVDPKPVEVDVEPDAPFRHEAVQIDAAYGKERFTIHLFLPRDTSPPYETVVWVPGTGAFDATSFADGRRGTETQVQTQIIRTGRAICLPECQGMYGRRLGNTSKVAKDIQVVQDVRRSIDYLETRPDEFQLDRLIYSGSSYGASHGAIVAAVENRFQAAVLINGGYQGLSNYSSRPEVDPYNFMSRVKIPVLMINGRYDAIFPVEAGQKPFLEHLGTPPEHKKLIHFKGGHGIPSVEAVQEMDKWLKAELASRKTSSQ